MPVSGDDEPATETGRALLARWAKAREMLDRLDRREPDQILVDHATDEMTILRQQEKLAVVIEP